LSPIPADARATVSAERLELHLPDESATRALGAALAPALVPGLRVWLQGDLGAGKTALVRAVLRALGFSGTVRSPTYTLVELYPVSRLNFYHLDLYRFEFHEEFIDAGLEECFGGDAVCFVEWPEKAESFLPPADLVLRLSVDGPGRRVTIEARSEKGQACLRRLARCLQAVRPPAGASSSAPDSPA